MALVMDRPRPAQKGKETDPVALRALLHRLTQRADKEWAQRRGDTETGRQADVLAAVAAAPGVSQHVLVGATGIDRSTMADIIKRLVRKGLVQRKRTKEDARAYAVTLTDAGRKTLRQVSALSQKVDQSLTQSLSSAEVGVLRGLLERMAV